MKVVFVHADFALIMAVLAYSSSLTCSLPPRSGMAMILTTRLVLCPLSLASLRVVLLPRKAGLLPALVDSVDEVLAKIGV
jgi:hypothetical protein